MVVLINPVGFMTHLRYHSDVFEHAQEYTTGLINLWYIPDILKSGKSPLGYG